MKMMRQTLAGFSSAAFCAVTSGCFLVSEGWLKLADRSLNGYLEKSSWEPALRFLRALLLLDCRGSASEYSR